MDEKPELLFALRHVNHAELVSRSGAVEALTAGKGTDAVAVLDGAEVGAVFGIEMAGEPAAPVAPKAGKKKGVAKKPTQAKAKPAKRKRSRKVGT